MTSKIIVFQPPEQKEVSLTKTERELLYEDLEKYSPLDSHHFKAFYDMETEEIESNVVDSTIVSIMFKYVASCGFPIVREIPKLNLKVRRRTFRKKLEKEHVTKDYFFTMQFSRITPGFTKGGQSLMLAPDVYYQVIGIKMPKDLRTFRDTSIPDLESVVNIFDLTTMGRFGLKNRNINKYVQSRPHFLHPKSQNSFDGKTIIFENSDHALEIIKNIIDKVKTREEYYDTYHASVYTSLRFSPFVKFREIMASKSEKVDEWGEVSLEPMKTTPEIDKVREAYKGTLSKYSNRFHHDLWNAEITNIFEKVKLLGIGHPKSQETINGLIEKNRIEKTIKFQKKQKSDSYLEFAKKQAIAFEKFKIKNLHELSKKQNDIVELEYKNIKKIEEGTKKMSESVKLVGQLYESVEELDYRSMRGILSQIKKLVPAKELDGKLEEKTALIKDTQDTSIVCPHILVKTNELIKAGGDPYKMSHVREHVITWFALPDVSLGYFCRVCGALLAEQDEEELVQFLNGQRVNSFSGIDRRQSLIWKEVAHTISTFVKFKDAVNLKKIITSVTSAISGEIGMIETKLTKVKTNNNDSIQDLLRIYIAIYTYAVIVHMIYLNYGKITFVTKEARRGGAFKVLGVDGCCDTFGDPTSMQGGSSKTKKHGTIEVLGVDNCSDSGSDDESPFVQTKKKMGRNEKKIKRVKRVLQKEDKKRLQNIFRSAIELIIKSKNALLNKLSNISIDSIKPLLIRAYQWVVSLKTDLGSSDTVRQHNTAHFLSIDPIYEYIWYAHSLKAFSEKKGQPELTDIKRYLGRTLTQIEEDYEAGKSIYETARTVEPWGKTKKAKYDYGSYSYLFNYTKNKTYNFDIVPEHEVISTFAKKYKYLDELADSIHQETMFRLMNPTYGFTLVNDLVRTHNNFKPFRINVADYYCLDGVKHNFNIFVFHKILPSGILDSKKTMEVTAKEVQGWFGKKDVEKIKDFKNYHFTDEKCSNCSAYLSKITKGKDLDKKLEKLDEMKAFYDYFENRCPEGNLHDYKIDAKKDIENCSKCGFTRKFLDTLNVKYREKYKTKYKEILEERKKYDQNSLKEFKKISKKFNANIKKYPAWTINNKPILQLSRTMSVKYNILINLGLSEGRKFENIEKEKENPHINSTVEEDILRNQYLRDYCLWVLRSYYLMKNYNILHNVTYALKEIIESNRAAGLENIHEALPEIYDEFNEKYMYYHRALKPKLLSNFLLNFLCESLNKIMEHMSNTKLAKLGKDFVKYGVDSIVQSEKDVSKPSPLSLIINKGESSTHNDAMVAGDEFYDISEDNDAGKALDELGDSSDGDDFARGDLDLDMDSGMSDNFMANPMDN